MELSFWIGAHLGGPVAEEQQKLLEERNTHTRCLLYTSDAADE